MDQSARGKTRPQALLPAHQNDHRLSRLSLLGNPYDDLDQIKAAPKNRKPDGQLKNGAGKHLDLELLIREVPSWQVRPNGVMSLLSASRRSPDQMGRA
jgi:hypothetical protein